MENKQLILIDETLREGMQYRGVMFSQQQRLTILDFQEQLGVDICQAGYPPAHELEANTVKALSVHAVKNQYRIRIAAVGRATRHDAAVILETGVSDLHLHLQIQPGLTDGKLDKILEDLLSLKAFVQKTSPRAALCIVLLDISRSDGKVLERFVRFCRHHGIRMLSLPDTSGVMAPNQIFDTLQQLCRLSKNTQISVHCHNDMGMAAANTIMGILAGADIFETSVLGIGERNGIADLYTTAKTLKDQGFNINVKTEDIQTFQAYYHYIDQIVTKQTKEHLISPNTPFFGDAVKTHVAGTHAEGNFGMAAEEKYYLNCLCGRRLVKKFIDLHQIACPPDLIAPLTLKIKTESFRLNRSLRPDEIKKNIVLLTESG